MRLRSFASKLAPTEKHHDPCRSELARDGVGPDSIPWAPDTICQSVALQCSTPRPEWIRR
ncbi:hypothetical protein EMIT048CA2_80236 [Pseudomonas chlororaphis]